ncbi:MAG: hypothetical protein U9Q66_00740, partial [Patescibacteria group bacterium]|nr:hypothetical protein [Patescibacteria group bacterium]
MKKSDIQVAIDKYEIAKEKEQFLLLNIEVTSNTIAGAIYVDEYNPSTQYFDNHTAHEDNYEVAKIESILDIVELFCLSEKDLAILSYSVKFHLKNRIKARAIKNHKKRLSELFATPEKVKVLGRMYKALLDKRRNNHDAALPNAVIIHELDIVVKELDNIAA